MKHMLLGFLIAVCCAQSDARRIHFTDSSNSWNIYANGGGSDYYSVLLTYKFIGDTIIGGNSYKIMTGSSQNRFISPYMSYPPIPARYFFREDTIARKLWVRRKSDAVDSLVYSNSWALGDTIRRKSLGTVIDRWFISGIDSTQMAGQWYRVFRIRSTFTFLGSPDYFAIIEGAGSTAWPDFIYSGAGGGESNYRLLCFHHNSATPAMSPELKDIYTHRGRSFTNAGPCDVPLVKLSVQNGFSQPVEAVLYPNPATRRSRIRLPYLIEEGQLRIHQMAGQEVSSTLINNATEVALPDVLRSPGLYFYRITDLRNGSGFSGRFALE